MPSAALALVGALVYGSADFFGGLAARRLRSIVVTTVAALSGLVVLTVLTPLVPGTWSGADAAWGAVAGVFGMISVVLLYACLAIGPMSILSPLTAVVSAIAPMTWGLWINGETLHPIGYAGLAVALVAVVLVAFLPGERIVRPSVRGLVMAGGAGVAIGAFLIAMDRSSAVSGLTPLVVSRATTSVLTLVVVAALVAAAVGRGHRARSAFVARGAVLGAHGWWLAVTCGVTDAVANACMLLALRLGDLAVVSALTALYPAGTVLLAAVVLRERIAPVQWAGLVLAMAAGAMLALA